MDNKFIVITGVIFLFFFTLIAGMSYDGHHKQEVKAACIQTLKDKPAVEIAMVCGVHK